MRVFVEPGTSRQGWRESGCSPTVSSYFCARASLKGYIAGVLTIASKRDVMVKSKMYTGPNAMYACGVSVKLSPANVNAVPPEDPMVSGATVVHLGAA